VILAGVLLKMGGYGILRFNYPLLPEVGASQSVMIFLAILGVVNILYGAFCALGQTDFKRLVAYSSVSHMGYVLLGIAVLRKKRSMRDLSDVRPRHQFGDDVYARRRAL
jgi:NADH-quinone oxidoreductase subunit M